MSEETPMDKMDESLREVFDVDPMTDVSREDRINAITIIPNIDEPQDTSDEQSMDTDHQEVRKNIYHLITQGHEALDHALLIAKDSDSARGFEVVAGLLKTIADMNAQLMDTHKNKKQTKNIGAKRMEGAEESNSNTTNNAIFVGSTTELSKMIESMNNKKG